MLAGRYRLIDLLAESGGGRFWRAQDTMLERFVALHVIAEDDPRAPELLAAARKSASVHDPRVLRVLDASTSGHLTYVVNEWGNGTSLDVLLTHGGPLGPRRSSWLVAEVAGAIATAHRADVAHGRLNPENVLIDRFGAIRLIGLGVDAALHGLPQGRRTTDHADLAGLLYCCLTGTWSGPSQSQVPPAPRDHGTVLPPRRVRAGVPNPLDEIWREIVSSPYRPWIGHEPPDVSSAEAIRDRLREFIGDPAGLQRALASSIPAINEIKPVDLPAVADPLPHDAFQPPSSPSDPAAADTADDTAEPTTEPTAEEAVAEEPEGTDAPAPDADDATTQEVSHADADNTDASDDPDDADESEHSGGLPENVSVSDLPTEAGMPVFEDDGDVDWFRTGNTPPPPPPPFEEPPERPLFAPEPENGEPVRRPREGVTLPKPASLGPHHSSPAALPPESPWDPDVTETAEQPAVPGRNWMRLGLAVAASLLLLVAIVVAFNLGRGRTPLGGDRDVSPSPDVQAATIEPTQVSDFDPLGNPPEEHPDQVAQAVDGDPDTAWSTLTYLQQFGPAGLKTGIGLQLDLGQSYEIAEVELTFRGAPTTAELYVLDDPATAEPSGDPAAEGSADGPSLILEPGAAEGRHLVVWLTSLPPVSGGFRGEIAEVEIRGR